LGQELCKVLCKFLASIKGNYGCDEVAIPLIRRRVKQSMRKPTLARHTCFAGIEAAAVHRAIAADVHP
jgi:hypothetical protein